jgi:ribose transport system ATP-binding protein
VRAGEVVGVGGLVGAGRTEVLKAIYGAISSDGEIRLAGQPARIASPRQAIAAGIVLAPEDRKTEGLILAFSVTRNIVLSILSKVALLGAFLRRGRMEAVAVNAVSNLQIRTPGVNAAVRNLSGGNQQKVVFAKELLDNPRLLLLDEPTRGVDVGAKGEIYRQLRALALNGLGVLVASSELPELIGLCDRIVVMHGGVTVAAFSAGVSEATLRRYSLGEALVA